MPKSSKPIVRPIREIVEDLDEIDSYLDDLNQWGQLISAQLEAVTCINDLARSINLIEVQEAIDRRMQKLSEEVTYVRDTLDNLVGSVRHVRRLATKNYVESAVKSADDQNTEK